MAVYFWHLVKCDLSSVRSLHVYNIHWTSCFVQEAKKNTAGFNCRIKCEEKYKQTTTFMQLLNGPLQQPCVCTTNGKNVLI